VWEKHEDSKEFLALQRWELDEAREELSKSCLELEGRFTEPQAR
jgi:hypothetical protein